MSFGRGQLGRGLIIGLSQQSDTATAGAGASTAMPQAVGRARSMADPQDAAAGAAAAPVSAVPAAFGRGMASFGRGAVQQPSGAGDSAALTTTTGPSAAAAAFGRGFGRGGAPPPATLPEAMSRMSIQGAPTQQASSVSPSASAQASAGGSGARPSRPRPPRVERVGPADKQGSAGQRLTLGTNFLRVEGADCLVYQYSILFKPSVDSRMQRDRLVMSIQDPDFQSVPGRVPSGNSLYTNRPLPRECGVYQAASGNMRVSIQLQLVGTATLSSLPSVYNIIFRSIQARMDLIEVRRHYYNPHASERVPGQQMEVWPGYITSVSHVDGGLRLMVESSHRVVRSQTVYDLFQSLGTRIDAMTDAIVGTSVVTRYNNKIMRVDQIETSMDCTHTFDRNGTQMSFLDYYKQAYNIEIKDPQQPMLISRGKPVRGTDGKTLEQRQVCLVPELCYVTGLTDEMRRNFHLMRDLAKFTKLSPDRRLHELRKFVQTINNRPECRKLLDAWGLRLLEEPDSVSARRFVNERVLFGSGGRGPFAPVPVGQTSEFKRALADNRVLIDGRLSKWLVVYPAREERTIGSFCETMMKKCRAMGITIAQPITVALQNDSTTNYTKAIRENFSTDLNLVCTVFTSQREERYNMVKRLCCTELVVPTQCLWTKTIGDPKKMGSVAVNVAAQINVKLGGALWGIDIPYERFMMVGIDVYHADKARTKSVTGIVASADQACTRWYSRVAFQRKGQEILDSMRVILQAQLIRYMNNVGAPPNVIFVFRDGVSDKQVGEVQQQEVRAIYEAAKGIDPNYRPKLVFLVVQKRINQRLFLRQGNAYSNPPPGTVLDHSITRPDMMDFFLVPQHVTQGTVTPTHYIVVECNGDVPVDEIQQLTFRSCHLYYNWAGSIRVPAPCQYAHKLVYMVGQNIGVEPAEAICDRLFYL